ncbi:MAG: carbohydrate ABC transporter permease [Brevefilum sp.]
MKRKLTFKKALIHLFLIMGAAIMVVPFVWSFLTSFKSASDVFSRPPFWIPFPPDFSAYVEIMEKLPFMKYALNTLKISVLVTLGQLFTCSLAGYAFAKIRFPGREKLFIAYIATLMIPGAVVMIPNFIVMRNLGWVDTHTALIVPAIGSAYGTFMMRQFFLTFPNELEDAAKLDGCSPPKFYWYILLPNAQPILATLGVMAFQGTWNDFQWPLIILNSESKRTLQIGLSFLTSEFHTDWTILMAGSVLTILPIIVLFFIAQKYFVQSIKLTGLKG